MSGPSTWLGALALAALVVVAPPDASAPAKPGAPAAGRLLVATRQVAGPIFGESVILLLDANDEGAAGLIVNRPTRLPLRELFPELDALAERGDRVHLGGPVEPRGLLFLFRSEHPPEDTRRILGDLHLGQSARALRAVVDAGAPASRLRAFVGHAGWAPGQLEGEIARGDWLVAEGAPGLPFSETPETMWREKIRALEGLRVRRETVPGPAPVALPLTALGEGAISGMQLHVPPRQPSETAAQ